ncbi:carbohydrate ABC transporter permease [Dactylosporangium sp. CA-233914]|uniref:carbohydrate ABC transporter permease n=1 Tax=Dactylosporangium sp. CA-233914 TaxID=3239934 RepID=UPI003D8D53AB
MTTRRIAVRPAPLIATAILTVVTAIQLFPFVMMLWTSLTDPAHTRPGSFSLTGWTLANFRDAWASLDWPHLYLNSLGVVFLIAGLQVVLALPAAYALARLRFRGERVAFWLVILCMNVPAQVTAIPLFYALSRIGWLDTYQVLILPWIGSGFGVFLLRQFILSIPQSVFDAARIDKARPVALLWHIVLPNVRPAIMAFVTFSVVLHWNDLYWPSVMLRSNDAATVTYAIAQYAGPDSSISYGQQMAAAILAIAPLIALYLVAQRHLVRGLQLTSGGE